MSTTIKSYKQVEILEGFSPTSMLYRAEKDNKFYLMYEFEEGYMT